MAAEWRCVIQICAGGTLAIKYKRKLSTKRTNGNKKSCNEDTHLEMGWTTWGYNILKENTTRRRYACHAKKFFGANDCLTLCCACN